MANKKHVKIVLAGADAIAEWRKGSGAELKLHLNNADFRDANLNNADFRDANLSHANLSRANLSGAILSDANLNGAILRSANLSGAILRSANLSRASLVGAILSDANLSRADLDGAHLGQTILAFVDLSSAEGLENVKHHSPSEIGVHTLYKSNGKIPDIFLRGCGIPEEFIAYKSSFVGSAIEFYSCFISYSHEDKAFARRLHDALQGRGIRCWLDEKQLLPGDDIYERVDHGIRMWDKVLLCASKSSLTSWWVDNEINSAFAKEQQLMKDRGKKVLSLIPLNLDGHLFSKDWERGWKNQVKSRLAPDFTNWKRNSDKFDEQLEQVIKALRADGGGREPAPTPKL